MTPKIYEILSRCIEEGIHYGCNKAYKHEDTPTQDKVLSSIHFAVMQHISEYFVFDNYE